MEFREKVKTLRKKLGLSQAKFGEKIGLGQVQVFQLENKKSTLGAEEVDKIAALASEDRQLFLADVTQFTFDPESQLYSFASSLQPTSAMSVRGKTAPERVYLEPVIYKVQRFSGKILTSEDIPSYDPSDIIEVRSFVTEPARVSVQFMFSMQVSYGDQAPGEGQGGGAEWRGCRIMREVPCYREEADAVELKLVNQVKEDVERERRQMIMETAVDHFGTPRYRDGADTASEL